MNALESRKKILLAESELDRVCLLEDVAALRAGFHSVTERAISVGVTASTLASLVTVAVAVIAAFRRGGVERTTAKPSWLQIAVKGAALIVPLWSSLASRRHESKSTPSGR